MSIAGDLSVGDRDQLNAHLGSCRACAREWQGITTTVEALGRSAPPALAPVHDLAAAALQRARSQPAHGARLSRRGAKALVSVALASAIVAVGVWALTRPPGPGQLLAIIEAATLERPTHEVQSVYDSQGRLRSRTEAWRSPGDDDYSEYQNADPPKHQTFLFRSGQGVYWVHDLDTGTYELVWRTVDPCGMEQKMLRAAGEVNLPGASSEGLRFVIGWLRLQHAKLTVREKDGKLQGKDVKIVEIRATPPPAPAEKGSGVLSEPVSVHCYLTPDRSRSVREVVTITMMVGGSPWTIDTWPIEYDTSPPPSLFELRPPKDATVLFRGQKVNPVWETMSDGEKQRVQAVVQNLARAWATGDFAEFCRYYDFGAGLEYGVKGKFTAQQIRQDWAGMVARQPERWRNDEIVFDYAVQATEPPQLAMSFWSIYPKRGASLGTMRLYRNTPSTEPGLLVLAREKVTDQSGRADEHGTLMFLKRIGGQYKVIMWRPPFA